MKKTRVFRLGFVGMLTTTGLTIGLVGYVCKTILI